jgi:ribonuclease G
LPEWLVERGIGETRAALVIGGEIIEARIELEGSTPAETVLPARLTSAGTNGRNAVARDEDGNEYLLPRGAPRIAEGAAVTIEVTREAIPGSEPWKRPLARITEEPWRTLPPLEQRLSGRNLTFPGPADELGRAGWLELLEQARSGVVQFAGGELRIFPTPALTLIDVDGHAPLGELIVAGAAEAAKAVRRLDIGGSIGIDLPTAGAKASRQAAAAALDQHLPQPFERTAVNGFGFVQIVRPRLRASLVELAQDAAAFEARALLRRVAMEPPGPKRLVCHPAVAALLQSRPDWLDRLARQLGGSISLRADAALPMSGAYAEVA